jgi:paxillin
MGRVVQALGKQWLPEHFLCGFCMNSLAGQNFTQRDNKAYCNGCFGKLFAA